MALHKVADASQYKHETSFKFIVEVHNCPALWGISSVVYKDIKNKQTSKQKMEQLRDKVSFVQTFLFRNRFLFHPLSLSDGLTIIHECYCTKSAMFEITECCDLTRPSLTCGGMSLPTFLSLPTRVCHVKAA